MDTASQRVIVAIDDSVASRRAVDAALAFATPGSRMTFVHAVDDASVLIPLAEGAYIDTEPLLEQLANDARALCDAAVAKALARGFDADAMVLHGAAASALVRYAAAEPAWMIVMGTHARTGLARVFHGSIAEAVVRTSPTPVLVVHGDDVERDGPIAVAVDGSLPASRAFAFALAYARTNGKRLKLLFVRVAEEWFAAPPFVATYRRLARDADVPLDTVMLEGEVGERIVAGAAAGHCSAIVLGTHGRGVLQRVVHPSVADAVIETARVPVIVVRGERTAASDPVALTANDARRPAQTRPGAHARR